MPLEDQAKIQMAIMYNDNGDYDDAIRVYDELIKDYPDVADILYEKCYTLYLAKRYAEVDELCRREAESGRATPMIYSLWGSVLDDNGDPNKALEVYRQGIEHFPDFAQLYSEGGMTYYRYGYTEDALKWFNNAIKVGPNHGSSYYRAAQLYADTKEKAWALVYAETYILLEIQNDRVSEMSKLIADIYKENVSFNGDSTSVRLASSVKLNVIDKDADPTTPNVLLGFSGVFEQCVGAALFKFQTPEKRNIDLRTIRGLADLRRAIIDVYYKGTDNLFGDSMYLLEFQRAVIEAGHWDAYNHWLFINAYPEEGAAYFEANPDALDAFAAWYGNAPYSLGDSRTVGLLSITDHERRLTMIEALRLCSDLLPRSKPDPTNNPN